MGKLRELNTVRAIVKDVLEEDMQARNSDMHLYIKICERINPEALSEPFGFVLENLKEMDLPNFETVRRSRQKLQEDNKEYSASANVEAQRMLNEDAFRNFARGK